MLLAATSSVICIKTAEKYISALLGQVTNFITVTLSTPQTKALDNMTYVHNTHHNCLQFLSEIFFNLHPCLIVPPQFAGGNLMGKMMKQNMLACAKIIQHKHWDIQPQYQSAIFTEPKTQLQYSHPPGSVPYPELQEFSPHSDIILLNIPPQYFVLSIHSCLSKILFPLHSGTL